MASVQQKIAGLYIAFFNRAADQSGLAYWESQSEFLGEQTAINTLAEGFATHTKFSALYDNLNNQEFVEAIYINTLGQSGDETGISYWTNLINDGKSRSDMVADFISISLDFNPDDEQYATLSESDIYNALQRQALITNKTEVSLEFVKSLQEKTNLSLETDANSAEALDADAAYNASIKILSEITHEVSTVEDAIDSIELLTNVYNAIEIINITTNINAQTIAQQIELLDNTASILSNTNFALGELSTSNTQGVDAISSDIYWNISSDRVITYSYNTTIPSDYYNYEGDLTSNWTSFNATQQTTMNTIFTQVGDLLDISFVEVEDTDAQSDGMIQLNIVDIDGDTSGFAFYPDDYFNYSGDIFLSSEFNSDPFSNGLNPGEHGWATMVHELGHALGLEHPFDGDIFLPITQDDINHTTMSYVNENIIFEFEYTDGFFESSISSLSTYLEPELYSLYDIAALQSVYGINDTTNIEDNIYIFNYTDYEINTIWDAGGEDTIDLSLTLGSNIIDLNSGSLNSADLYTVNEIITLHQNLIDDYGDFDDWISDTIIETNELYGIYTGKNNLAIATGVIIENIYTGSGDDIITDNEVDNIIQTYLGDDTIYLGYGGYDYVDGGGGYDTIYIDLAQNEVSISTIKEDGSYNLTSSDFGVNFIGIESIIFNDSTNWIA